MNLKILKLLFMANAALLKLLIASASGWVILNLL